MDCCSNNVMAGEALSSMLQGGCRTLYGGIVWLLSIGNVSTREDISSTSSTIPNDTESFINTNTVVSILFIVHVAAVVAFIISHCKVVKKKSQ